jgi:hypothetical protein
MLVVMNAPSEEQVRAVCERIESLGWDKAMQEVRKFAAIAHCGVQEPSTESTVAKAAS